MMAWLWLAAAICSEVAATLSLTASDGLRKRRWLPAIAIGYVAAFTALWLSMREGMHVGVAYGIWAAAGVALTAVLARWLFGERLTWLSILGILAIGAGALLVELGASGA